MGGRATSGLVMAALRCLSKGALKQNLTGLRQSTSIYVMIAALIVLTSVLIAGILLPRLAHQIEAMNKPTGEHGGVDFGVRFGTKFVVMHDLKAGEMQTGQSAGIQS